MERARASVQVIGCMHFSQRIELINPGLNNGLPPNLTANEPSQSFIIKGVDVGRRCTPIVSHIQTAETSMQWLNSLALVSARYAHTAFDVLLPALHPQPLCFMPSS